MAFEKTQNFPVKEKLFQGLVIIFYGNFSPKTHFCNKNLKTMTTLFQNCLTAIMYPQPLHVSYNTLKNHQNFLHPVWLSYGQDRSSWKQSKKGLEISKNQSIWEFWYSLQKRQLLEIVASQFKAIWIRSLIYPNLFLSIFCDDCWRDHILLVFTQKCSNS